MPYLTFQEVADMVGGAKRLVERVYVGGHEDEDASSHPYFDQHAATADQDVDIALHDAGYETPLAALTDPKLRNAYLGILIGYLSQSSSQREQWMIDLETAGRLDLASLAARTLPVTGAIEAESTADDVGIYGSDMPNPLFEVGDPYSDVNSVYGSLGPGPWRRYH